MWGRETRAGAARAHANIDLKYTLGRKILKGALDAGFENMIVQGGLWEECEYPETAWSIHRVKYILDLPDFDNAQGHGYRQFFMQTAINSRAHRWFFCPLAAARPVPKN